MECCDMCQTVFKNKKTCGCNIYDEMGSIYKDGIDYYLLAQVGYRVFCLINPKTGNRLSEASDIWGEIVGEAKKVEGWRLELHQIEEE